MLTAAQQMRRLTESLLQLARSDSGQGIAESDLPNIFDRFYRADQAHSRAAGRSGLGLPICQAIVEAQGGRIEAASTVGTGTTFTVRFPAK